MFKVLEARWADRESLSRPEYEEITSELLRIDGETGRKLVGGVPPSLHWSRRFEYPWALLASEVEPGMRVADIGLGLSPLQFYLARCGASVTSVDMDLGTVRRIRDLASRFGDITGVPVEVRLT
jgi:2-polyprenyl-3-methyl-5-hydroxy-6-metoxy-1,4-benzoquinol methylase